MNDSAGRLRRHARLAIVVAVLLGFGACVGVYAARLSRQCRATAGTLVALLNELGREAPVDLASATRVLGRHSDLPLVPDPRCRKSFLLLLTDIPYQSSADWHVHRVSVQYRSGRGDITMRSGKGPVCEVVFCLQQRSAFGRATIFAWEVVPEGGL